MTTAGADKVGECGDLQTVLNKIWDPIYKRPLSQGTINMMAISAVRQRKGDVLDFWFEVQA